MKEVEKAPSCHHAVEAEDDGGAQHADAADHAPEAVATSFGVGVHGVAAATASHEELAEHSGETEEQREEYVNEDEGGTTVLACGGGETPDVAQTDGGTSGGEYHTEL